MRSYTLTSFIFHNISKVNPSLFHIPPLHSFYCQVIFHGMARKWLHSLVHQLMDIWFSLGSLFLCRQTFSYLLGINAGAGLLGLVVTLHLTFRGWDCLFFRLGYSFFQAPPRPIFLSEASGLYFCSPQG